MSSDTHPDAPEHPPLPAPDRAWLVPDATSSVFDAPAPPPTLPTLPALPTLPPVTVTAPPPTAALPGAVNPAPYAYGEVPGGMAAVHRASLQHRTSRTPVLHRVLRTVIVLAILAGVGGAGYFVVQGIRSHSRVPEFATDRPAYGTVVLEYEDVTDGVTEGGTITAGADPMVFELVSSPASAEPLHLISDGVTVYRDGGGGEWSTFAVTPEFADVMVGITRLPMFEDYIPSAARPYVTVADRSDVEIDGVAMERLELLVDDAAFALADPAASADWEAFVGLEGDERTSGTRLVITVDDQGIAWVVESWSDVTSDRSTYRIVSFDGAPFAPTIPAAGSPVEAPVAIAP